MYTPENLNAREDLKDNYQVREAINEFIKKNFKLKGDPKACSKREYIDVFMKVGLILQPQLDSHELEQLLEDDFRKDLQPRTKRVREEQIPITRDGEDEVQQEEPPEEEVEDTSKKDSIPAEALFDGVYDMVDNWC